MDNQKVKARNSRAVSIVMVRCKKHPETSPIYWLEPHSSIFSECKLCSVRTDIPMRDDKFPREKASEHYTRYEHGRQRRSGEDYEACMDSLIAEVVANPQRFEVPWNL